MTLRCEGGQRILVLRAVWGRYSRAICPDDRQEDNRDQVMCGDRRHSMRIISQECGDKEQCELTATSSVFGDPCPGVREFLEVQYQCQDVTIRRPVTRGQRRPGLSGDIALVWGAERRGKSLDTIFRERLPLDTSRIPITEAPSGSGGPNTEHWRTELGTQEQETPASDLTWLLVLALVSLILVTSLVIIKALGSRHQRAHSFRPARGQESGRGHDEATHHTPCLMATQARLLYCRPDLSSSRQFKDLSCSRQFASEPSLGRPSYLVLDSSSVCK